VTALVIASFAREAPFRGAIQRLRETSRAIVGLWSPMPVAIPEPQTRAGHGLPLIMAAAGIGGAALFYLLIWWSAVLAYPFDSGARPLHSWPAFLVAPVELGALIAGIAGVAAFLMRARLTRLHDAAFELDEVSDAARDRFVIAIRCDAGSDANALIAMLAEAGAVHSRLIAQ
jgi:hypothetical protein